jgi:hypothetical protein
MSLKLHLIYKKYAYHIYSHLNLSMNNLSEKGEFSLNPKEIKISPRGKRADTLNKEVKSEERVSS